jgi:hypothetical protein
MGEIVLRERVQCVAEIRYISQPYNHFMGIPHHTDSTNAPQEMLDKPAQRDRMRQVSTVAARNDLGQGVRQEALGVLK